MLTYGVKETGHKRPQIIWFHLYELSKIGKSPRGKVDDCWGPGKGRMIANRHWASFWDNENILELRQWWWLHSFLNIVTTNEVLYWSI